MKHLGSEHRLLSRHHYGEASSLPVAAGRQFMANLGNGIDRNTDVITTLTYAPRNAFWALWQGTNQLLPMAASALHRFPKEYAVHERSSPYEGIANTAHQIRTEFQKKRYISGIIAGTTQLTDGIVDDGANALSIGPPTIIKPIR